MGEDSIAMEAIVGAIAKGGWILFGLVLGGIEWQRRKDKVKLDDTYSKKETQEQIDLRMKPIEIKMDHYTEVQEKMIIASEKLTEAVIKLTVEMAVLQQQLAQQKEKN